MLLIDGVKYELWTPPNEDEFEQLVKEHTKDIFGEESIYFDRKQKLKSLSGIGSIPDGYAISLQGTPCWYICEVELHTHPLYEHIVPQMTKFINGVKSLSSQRELINAFYGGLNSDLPNEALVRSKIGPTEVYHFISDLISKPPILVIVINQKTLELEEVCDSLPIEVKVVEFQTFVREGVGLPVHAHLFEPLYQPVIHPKPILPPVTPTVPFPVKRVIAGKVIFEELVSAGLLRDKQILYFYNTRPFTDERAQVLAASNQLKYEVDGRTYSKSELAKILLIKHGFKNDEHGVAGPKYWKTEEGKLLRDLEEQVRVSRGDRA